MLWNTLIQPHYYFACCSWYPNFSMSLKTKLLKIAKKSISYLGSKIWNDLNHSHKKRKDYISASCNYA